MLLYLVKIVSVLRRFVRKSRNISFLGKIRHCCAEYPVCFTIFALVNLLSLSLYLYMFSIAQFESRLAEFKPLPYLINSSTCHLKDYPVFDRQTKMLFRSHLDQDFGCSWNLPPFAIRRVNFTWIEVDYPSWTWFGSWECFATEVQRTSDDYFEIGPKVGPLGRLTNFANNLTKEELENEREARWDSVKVICSKGDWSKPYTRVVPLVQAYQNPESTNQTSKSPNILLLGIDSVSRLNFLRHMVRTKQLIERQGFIPLYGYHKIGENSFPNIMPMFTGQRHSYFCNHTNSWCNSKDFKFDSVPLIFKDYSKKGYLTTFIEDMPYFGFFTYNFGGFLKQMFDYYLRPTNLAIVEDMYWSHICYQEKLESEIYWEYMYDQLLAFQERGNQSYISFAHVSTLTHDEFNYVGYADKPFHNFLENIFNSSLHSNTAILFYSDHAIRFGLSVYTKSHFYEERLPFVYIYLPDSLSLPDQTVRQARDQLRRNQHRLTSHFDIHATSFIILHLLNGNEPEAEPFGRSLLTPIPVNRTCDQAGIPPESCLCNSYKHILVTPQVEKYSQSVVDHMNRLMVSQTSGNYCVPLTLQITDQAYESYNSEDNQWYQEVHFSTEPNEAHFKAVVSLGKDNNKVVSVNQITRTNLYGEQSHCVKSKREIVQFCLCWKVYLNSFKSRWKMFNHILKFSL